MTTWIAERRLLFTRKGDAERRELVIRVGQLYLLEKVKVDFEFHEGASGCSGEFVAGPHEAYGVDSLQALQLAADIESVLKALSRKYDFFFPSGNRILRPVRMVDLNTHNQPLNWTLLTSRRLAAHLRL